VLARSIKSAFIMASAFTMTALVVSGVIITVRYLTGTPNLVISENTPSGANSRVIEPVVAVLGLILVVGFGLAMFSLWIYRSDDSHFGPKGAIRWAASGALFALLAQPASMLVPRPGSAESAWLAGLYTILRGCLGFLTFALSYYLVFRWLPFTREQYAERLEKSKGDQATHSQLRVQKPTNISKVLMTIRQSPEARSGLLAISWFVIGGGILLLVIGLITSAHPNPHLLPSLIVMGFTDVVTGFALLLFLRQSRIAPWLMLISCILLVVFLYLMVQVFTYSP
jgi:hypothetical protein